MPKSSPLAVEKDEITGKRFGRSPGMVYNVTTETGNLFANKVLVHNSGGLGTPPHLRIEAGAIHKANGGVLYIDEVSTLKPRSQQELE